MNRRIFLKLGMNAAAFSVAHGIMPAWGKENPTVNSDQFFIYMHFHNAWDISLFSDPFLGNQRPDPSKYFIEYRKEDLLNVGQNFYGPALQPLTKFLPRMSIVNGLFMNADDVGHDSLASYMSTGGTSKDPVSGDIFHAISPNLGGVMTNTSDLPQPSPNLPFRNIRNLAGGGLTDTLTVGSAPIKDTPIQRAMEKAGRENKKFDTINEALKKTMELTPDEDWALLVAAFLSGASTTAQISIESPLDTHLNHINNHINILKQDFTSVADLLTLLESVDLLNKTTIVIGSEFCRTPDLNGPLPLPNKPSAPGKDHNPWTNSALILGPGINPGKVIGASRLIEPPSGRPYLAAVPITVDTEIPKLSETNTKIIRPTTLWHTVMLSMGIPKENIPSDFRGAGVIKSLLRT